MRGRLDKTVRFPQMKILVDFDDLGFSEMDQWSDITDYVIDIDGSKEKERGVLGGVSYDITTLTLDNTEKTFSNDNTNSPFHGKVKSNLRFVLKSGFKNEELENYVIGYVDSFKPMWRDKNIIMQGFCPMNKLKKTKPPTTKFQGVTWNELVEALMDQAGIDPYFIREIPETEFYYNYFKFEEEDCFQSLKRLMEVCSGQAFFDGEYLKVLSKLALDYVLNTSEKHEIIVDDIFSIEENVEQSDIINNVAIKSDSKSIGQLQILWYTPENLVRVENEQIVYNGGDYIYINDKNLPLYYNQENTDIEIKNLTNGIDIEWDLWNAELGRIKLSASGLSNLSNGDLISITYSYQQLVIMPGDSRKFVATIDDEVFSFMYPDVVAFDASGVNQIQYSTTPDTVNSLSLQGFVEKEDGQTVEITLKNNTNGKVALSTLQLRGYPVKVLNPLEVYNKNQVSIDQYDNQEIELTNNYINNLALAEKLSEFIVDNNSVPRKRITIEINGYPELLLNDVAKVTESGSGINHKFSIERINFRFSVSDGWIDTIDLLELDSSPWSYESFSGESTEKTHTGTPSFDFIEDINANLIRNGGAELWSGAYDRADINAIEDVHYIPDFWQFTRSSGDATARVRTGGNYILHGRNSFEITTTNNGYGYFEQLINYMTPNDHYTLSAMARVNHCTGEIIVEEYDENDLLLEVHTKTIDSFGHIEMTFVSDPSAAKAVIKIKKNQGDQWENELWFDKVKFENSDEATVYVENEDGFNVKLDTTYANSVTIGNNYGIQVYDDQNEIKVRMGQYEPGKYGLKIYGGAIEIVDGLPEDQIDPNAREKWNSAKAEAVAYADELKALTDADISNLNDEINAIETGVDQATLDGIINETEAKAIQRDIESLKTTKSDLDSRYDTIYNNTELTGSYKTNLSNAKAGFNSAHTTLINIINTSVSDKKISSLEQSNIDNAFIDYRSKLNLLVVSLENAVNYVASKLATEARNQAIEHANALDGGMREDLGVTAALPTSIKMNGSGITAYANSGGYARLDYRGLYIYGGAIQISGGLPQSQLSSSTSSKINRGDDAKNTIENKNNLTYINSSGIYTGSVTAYQINATYLSSITANLGTVTAGSLKSNTTIDVATDLRVGNRVYIGDFNSNSAKYLYFNNTANIRAIGPDIRTSARYFSINDGDIFLGNSSNYNTYVSGDLEIDGEFYKTSVEYGYCGIGGYSGHSYTGNNVAGYGCTYRTRKTYTPSSISLTSSSVYGASPHAISINRYGFWFYITNTTSSQNYKYWRGSFRA